MYNNLYEILQTYIYGDAVLSGEMELTLTLLATIGSIFVVALPFILVWRVVKMICG